MSLSLYEYHSDPESLVGFDEYMHQNTGVAFYLALSRGYGSEQIEDAIATEALYSYAYAKDVLEERFPKGEDSIATHTYYSYYYAEDVLKGERVEKIEDGIAESAEYSYYYALLVLDDRFEKGEPSIRGSMWQEDYEREFGIEL